MTVFSSLKKHGLTLADLTGHPSYREECFPAYEAAASVVAIMSLTLRHPSTQMHLRRFFEAVNAIRAAHALYLRPYTNVTEEELRDVFLPMLDRVATSLDKALADKAHPLDTGAAYAAKAVRDYAVAVQGLILGYCAPAPEPSQPGIVYSAPSALS